MTVSEVFECLVSDGDSNGLCLCVCVWGGGGERAGRYGMKWNGIEWDGGEY